MICFCSWGFIRSCLLFVQKERICPNASVQDADVTHYGVSSVMQKKHPAQLQESTESANVRFEYRILRLSNLKVSLQNKFPHFYISRGRNQFMASFLCKLLTSSCSHLASLLVASYHLSVITLNKKLKVEN